MRLIVDTGLHYKGMKRDDAIKMFSDKAWDDTDFTEKEVRTSIRCDDDDDVDEDDDDDDDDDDDEMRSKKGIEIMKLMTVIMMVT